MIEEYFEDTMTADFEENDEQYEGTYRNMAHL